LDRIFSYHLPGQELATNIGLWVWNLRLVRGFEMAPPPALRPVQQSYVAKVETRTILPAPSPVPDDGQQPAVQEGVPAQEGSTSVTPPTPPTCAMPQVAEVATVSTEAEIPKLTVSTEAEIQKLTVSTEAEIQKLLRSIDWDEALRRNWGWSFDPTTACLKCRDARYLAFISVRKGEHAAGRTRLIFGRPCNGCLACELPARCLDSDVPKRAKRIEISVPTDTAIRLRELLAGQRNTAAESRAVDAAAAPPKPRGAFVIAPIPPTPVLLAVLPALFLPAAARQLLRSAAAGLTVAVTILAPPARPPRPILVAPTIAHKQHRRKTWRQNFERYEIDPGTAVSIEFTGGEALRRLLSISHTEAAK
jgi:hypothetical protein